MINQDTQIITSATFLNAEKFSLGTLKYFTAKAIDSVPDGDLFKEDIQFSKIEILYSKDRKRYESIVYYKRGD